MSDKSQDQDEVKFLAEMASSPASWSNSNWLAVMAVAFVITFPNASNRQVTLPFELAIVDQATFDLVGFFILAATVIAFCQGYASAHGAIRLAHARIDKMDVGKRGELRKYFDFLSSSTYWRIAPLVNSILGSNQKSWIAASIYVFLKIVTTLVVFGIPAMALYSGLWRALDSSGQSTLAFLPASVQAPLVLIVFCGASVALVIDFFSEIGYIRDVAQYFFTGEFPSRSDAA